MSPKQRFAWWVVVVVVWSASAMLRLGGYDLGWTVATLVQTGAVVLMLGLLATTPPDAIKLRGPVSWTVLMLGVWLNLVCAVPIRHDAVVIAAVVLAVAVPVGVWSTALCSGASAWWVALVAWSPALPALVARPVRGEPGGVIALAWALCLAGLGVSLFLVWFLSRASSTDWRKAAWILGIATALSGLVPWLS